MDEDQLTYNPSDKEEALVKETYDYVDDMLEVMDESYPELNDRTAKQFIDDSQKRANSYVPSRDAQGKDEWQANVFTKTTRNKVKAYISGLSKNLPDIAITATNEKNQVSVARAEVMKTLVEASYVDEDNNPELAMYYDAWDTAINGTKYKYDGYLKVRGKVKVITNYDPTTGEVEYEEKDEIIEDKPVEIDIPVTNLLLKSMYIKNIQDQPAIAWIDYVDKESFDFEFSNYKNHKYVKTRGELISDQLNATFFGDRWKERTGTNKPYEVVRLFVKGKDIYRIVANGVVILDAPLLWGKRKKKYPIAKAIFEPFANSNFALGNSLPNILMGEQDVENAFVNSLTDEVYRAVTTPLIIGQVNKDSFDLEDEEVTHDNKIYVEDVSQVTPLPVRGIDNGSITMLKYVKAGLEEDSVDKVQGGSSGSGSTAREIVIANERAEELKGDFYTMMKDLWLQKYRLRILNILMNYSQPLLDVKLTEEEAATIEPLFRVYRVENTEIYTGETGTKEIRIKKDQASLTAPYKLDIEEEQLRMQGQPTEIIETTSTYLDEYDYQVRVVSETLRQKMKSLKMAMVQEKVMGVAKLFPEIFMANKQVFFKDFVETFGDDPSKYETPQQAPTGLPEGMQLPPELQQYAQAQTTANKTAQPTGAPVV